MDVGMGSDMVVDRSKNVGKDMGEDVVEDMDALASSRRLCILGHTGMGGCCAYADLSCGLAVCVLTNTFWPEILNGGGPGGLCKQVDERLRRRLGLSLDAVADMGGHAEGLPRRQRKSRGEQLGAAECSGGHPVGDTAQPRPPWTHEQVPAGQEAAGRRLERSPARQGN